MRININDAIKDITINDDGLGETIYIDSIKDFLVENKNDIENKYNEVIELVKSIDYDDEQKLKIKETIKNFKENYTNPNKINLGENKNSEDSDLDVVGNKIDNDNDEYISEEETIINYKSKTIQFEFNEDYISENKQQTIEEYIKELNENMDVKFNYKGNVVSVTQKINIETNQKFLEKDEIKKILSKKSEMPTIKKDFENTTYKIFIDTKNQIDINSLDFTSKLEENGIFVSKISNEHPFYIEVYTTNQNILLDKKELDIQKELERNQIKKEIENLSEKEFTFLKNVSDVKMIPTDEELRLTKDELNLSKFRLETFSLFNNIETNHQGKEIIDNLRFFVSSYNEIDLNKILSKINVPYYIDIAKKDLHLRGKEKPVDVSKSEIEDFISESNLNLTYRTEDKIEIIKRVKYLLNTEIENLTLNNVNGNNDNIINSHKKSLQDLNDTIQSFYINRRTREVSNLIVSNLKLKEDENVLNNKLSKNSIEFNNKVVVEKDISTNLKNIFSSVKNYKVKFDGDISIVTKRSFNNIYEILNTHYSNNLTLKEQEELKKEIMKNIYLYLNISFTENDLNINVLENKILILAKENLKNEEITNQRFDSLNSILSQQKKQVKNKTKKELDEYKRNLLTNNTEDYEVLVKRLIQLSVDKEEQKELESNLNEFIRKKNYIMKDSDYNPKNILKLNELNVQELKNKNIFKRLENLDKEKEQAFKDGNFIKSSNMLIFQETVKNMNTILNENLLKQINILTLEGKDNVKLKINEIVRNSFQNDRRNLLSKIELELIKHKDVIFKGDNITDIYSVYRKDGFKTTSGDAFIYKQISLDILDNFEKNFSFIVDSAVNIIEKTLNEDGKYTKEAFDTFTDEQKDKLFKEFSYKEKIEKTLAKINKTYDIKIENFNKALKLDGVSFEEHLFNKVGKFLSTISEKDEEITSKTIENIVINEFKLLEKNLMSEEEVENEEKTLHFQIVLKDQELKDLEIKIVESENLANNGAENDLINLTSKRIQLNKEKNDLEISYLENKKNKSVIKIIKNLNNDESIEKNENNIANINKENNVIERIINLALNNQKDNSEEMKKTLNELRNSLNSDSSELKTMINSFIRNKENTNENIILEFQKKLLSYKKANIVKLENINFNNDIKQDFIKNMSKDIDVMLNQFKIKKIINQDNISEILFSNDKVKLSIQDNLGINPENASIIFDSYRNNLFNDEGDNLIINEMKNKLHFKDLIQEFKKENKESIKIKINSLNEVITNIKEKNRKQIGKLSHIIIKQEIEKENSLLSKMFLSYKNKFGEKGVSDNELKIRFIMFLEQKNALEYNDAININKINIFDEKNLANISFNLKKDVTKEENLKKIIVKLNKFISDKIKNNDFKKIDIELDSLIREMQINKIEDINLIKVKINDLLYNGIVNSKDNLEISYEMNDDNLLKKVNGKDSNLLNEFANKLTKKDDDINIKDINFLIENQKYLSLMNIKELSNNKFNNINDLNLFITNKIENFKLKDFDGDKNLIEKSNEFKQLKTTDTLSLYKDVVTSTDYKFNMYNQNKENGRKLKDIINVNKEENLKIIFDDMFGENKNDFEIMFQLNNLFDSVLPIEKDYEKKQTPKYSKIKKEEVQKNKEKFIENMINYINNFSEDKKDRFNRNLNIFNTGDKQITSIFANISSEESIITKLSIDKVKLKNFLDKHITENSILNNISDDVLIDLLPSSLKTTNKREKENTLNIKAIDNAKEDNVKQDKEKIKKYLIEYLSQNIKNLLSKDELKGLSNGKKISLNKLISEKDLTSLVDFVYSNNNDFSSFKNIKLKNNEGGYEYETFLTLDMFNLMDNFVSNYQDKTFESAGNAINKRNNLKEIKIESDKLISKYDLNTKFNLEKLVSEDNNELNLENNNNFILIKKMLGLETNGLKLYKNIDGNMSFKEKDDNGIKNKKILEISAQQIKTINTIEELNILIKNTSSLKNEDILAEEIISNKFYENLKTDDDKSPEGFYKNIKNNDKPMVKQYLNNLLKINDLDKDLNIIINEKNDITFVSKEGIPILEGIVSENDFVNYDLINSAKASLYNSKSIETFATNNLSKNINKIDVAIDETKNLFTEDKKYDKSEKHTFEKISSQKEKLSNQIENLESLEKSLFENETIRLFLFNEKDGGKELDAKGEHKYVEYKVSDLLGFDKDIINNISKHSSLKEIDLNSNVEEIMSSEGYTYEKGSKEYNNVYMRIYEQELNKLDMGKIYNKRKKYPEEVFENQLKIQIEEKGQTKSKNLNEALEIYRKKYRNLKQEIKDSKTRLIMFEKVESQFVNRKENLKKSFGELKPTFGESQPKKNMFKKLILNMGSFINLDTNEMLYDMENMKDNDFLQKYSMKLNMNNANPTYDDLFNNVIDKNLELFGKDDLESSKCLESLDILLKDATNHSIYNKKMNDFEEKMKKNVKNSKDFVWKSSKDFGANVGSDFTKSFLFGL